MKLLSQSEFHCVRILLITDAWHPQKNGVVVTLTTVLEHLKHDEVLVVHPGIAGAKPAVRIYHDIQLVRNPFHVVGKCLDAFEPDRIHLVTEGPLGIAGRLICARRGLPFTTSYHTRLPEYAWHLYRIPPFLVRAGLRWFHGRSSKVLVPTPSLLAQLRYPNAVLWARGVDLERFYPEQVERPPGPTLLYVGRVSKEKNLDAFCTLTGYRRLIVGDGPYRETLQRRNPDVHFAGHMPHDRLRAWYNRADLFVFPSRADTFGLVMLEAMACGLPVVAYNVTGPKDVVQDNQTGCLGDDLAANVTRALAQRKELSRNALAYARGQSWANIADQFTWHIREL
jgi:glycosyltransferase involved in cell wall biosynthesis